MICYNKYGDWVRKRFGCKVQKISIDAGFSCPNRDGTIGKGGCIYCNNATFNPGYCTDTAGRVSQEYLKKIVLIFLPIILRLSYWQVSLFSQENIRR